MLFKEVEEIKQLLATHKNSTSPTATVPECHIVDGENVMMWTSKDGPKFALDLIAKMFLKNSQLGTFAFRQRHNHP